MLTCSHAHMLKTLFCAQSLAEDPKAPKTKIMGTMSQRAVQGLKEEMEFLGPVKTRDVESAQTDVVGKVRALEESGEIVLSSGSDDIII